MEKCQALTQFLTQLLALCDKMRLGIRGRFLMLAAAAIGVSFVGFIVFSIVLGKLAGFIAMLIMAAVGIATIFIKQRGGLHNKRRDNGIFIYKNIFKR